MKIMPKNELIILIDTLLYGNVTNEEVTNIFENYGDDYFPRGDDPPENQNRRNLLNRIKSN